MIADQNNGLHGPGGLGEEQLHAQPDADGTGPVEVLLPQGPQPGKNTAIACQIPRCAHTSLCESWLGVALLGKDPIMHGAGYQPKLPQAK